MSTANEQRGIVGCGVPVCELALMSLMACRVWRGSALHVQGGGAGGRCAERNSQSESAVAPL